MSHDFKVINCISELIKHTKLTSSSLLIFTWDQLLIIMFNSIKMCAHHLVPPPPVYTYHNYCIVGTVFARSKFLAIPSAEDVTTEIYCVYVHVSVFLPNVLVTYIHWL